MNHSLVDVDYREDATTAGGLIDRLGAELVQPRVNLPFGDITWATEQCSYGIELKSISDFFGSLWSSNTGERLEWQLDGLRSQCDVAVLGIHGILWSVGGKYKLLDKGYYVEGKRYLYARGIKNSEMRVSSVEGFLASISQQGITVIYRTNKEMLLDAITAYFHESVKDVRTTFNHHLSGGKHQSKDPVFSQYMDVLLGIQGLGEKRAKALLEAFKTPRAVFYADDKALMSVDGIGKDTVVKIREALG